MNPYLTQMQQQNPYMNPRVNQFYQPQTNGINWVQGIEGAKAWQLVPNSNAVLLDSENDGIFYIKISDNVGMCTLRAFKYEEMKAETKQSQPLDLSEYVKKSELESLITSILGGMKNEQPVSGNDGTTSKQRANTSKAISAIIQGSE